MSKLVEAMNEVNDLNRTHGVTQRGGKKYTEVFVRVEAFRKAFGTDLGIDTQILVDDGKRVVIKAIVTSSAGVPVGSGMAEEIRGQGNVNKTSALENAETSAIGRALASLGLHGGSYASLNEIDAVQRKTQAQVQQRMAPTPEPKPEPAPEPTKPSPYSDLPWQMMYHNGKPAGDACTDANDFVKKFTAMLRKYAKPRVGADHKIVSPRERMTSLKELKEANHMHIDRLGEANMANVDEVYRGQLKMLGAEHNQGEAR